MQNPDMERRRFGRGLAATAAACALQLALPPVLAPVLARPAVASIRMLRVALPDFVAPWIIRADDSGIVTDLMRAALKASERDLLPFYVPLARLGGAFAIKEVDAAGFVEGDRILSHHRSAELARLTTTVVTLAGRFDRVAGPQDFTGRALLAFQGAQALFPKLMQLQEVGCTVREIANQQSQVMALFEGRVDALLLDRSIWLYWARLAGNPMTSVLHSAAPITGVPDDSPIHAVFREAADRIAFDSALAAMRADGRWQAIINRYTGS